jgi:alpha-galactosidase
MGDWLEPGKAFGGNIAAVLKTARDKGFEPAIWVAPFIAATSSKVQAEHPTGSSPTPPASLFSPRKSASPAGAAAAGRRSMEPTPEIQEHFIKVFRTMREQCG